ncbi:MAG: hypothetical protein WBO10_01925 [Pyrinomonadaceae bacterium]
MNQVVTFGANNKKARKLSYKRKEALIMARQMADWLEDQGFPVPSQKVRVFGRRYKVTEAEMTSISSTVKVQLEDELSMMAKYHEYRQATPIEKQIEYRKYCEKEAQILFKKEVNKRRKAQEIRRKAAVEDYFTDKETGECFADKYAEVARAYYMLRELAPACYTMFPYPNNKLTSQLLAFNTTKHRLDPVYNQFKAQALRSLVKSWLQEEEVWKKFQPMHLVLTVPHPGGEYKGQKFYAKEMDRQFRLLRDQKFWKKYIHGGIKCFEVSRKGKNGLHIHIHALVLQRPEFSRNQVHAEILEAWKQMTGAYLVHYETLFVHKRAEEGNNRSPWIMETDERGNKIWDDTRQEWKRKKFYLDDRESWFAALDEPKKVEAYTKGVLECIKYHFKNDSFRKKTDKGSYIKNEWDIDLIAEILQHSKSMRMFDRFGHLYNDARLSLTSVERLAAVQMEKEQDGFTEEHDGVEDKQVNPWTKEPAKKGEYIRVLALAEDLDYYGHQKDYWPALNTRDHTRYFRIRDDVPIRNIIRALSKKAYHEILYESEYQRLKNCGFRWKAERTKSLFDYSWNL